MTTPEATALGTEILAGLEAAWNLADGTAFAAAFTHDADFVDIRGGHHRGRSAVGAGHQALFDSLYAGSTIRYQLDTARTIAPECVVAVAGARLDSPRGPAAGVHHSRLTAVLTQDGGAWSIAAFHNALVQADG
jgi:uncharacterized protein (TIGR02246 family)